MKTRGWSSVSLVKKRLWVFASNKVVQNNLTLRHGGKTKRSNGWSELSWDGWHFRAGALLPGPIFVSVIYAESHTVNLWVQVVLSRKTVLLALLLQVSWWSEDEESLDLVCSSRSTSIIGRLPAKKKVTWPLASKVISHWWTDPNRMTCMWSALVTLKIHADISWQFFFLAWLPFKRDLKG